MAKLFNRVTNFSKMNVQEIAEQLAIVESNGYTREDAEWMDLVIEAQWLLGYKSELETTLQEHNAQQEQNNQVMNNEAVGPNSLFMNEPAGPDHMNSNTAFTYSFIEQEENTPFDSYSFVIEEQPERKCEW